MHQGGAFKRVKLGFVGDLVVLCMNCVSGENGREMIGGLDAFE
jgi:hypothetical protein